MNANIQQLIDKLSVLAAAQDVENIHIEVMIDTTKQLYEQLYLLRVQYPVSENLQPTASATIRQPQTFDQYIRTSATANSSETDMNDEITALFNSEYDKTVLQDTENHRAIPVEDNSMPETTTPPEEPVKSGTATTSGTSHTPTIESGISFEFPSARNVTRTTVSNPQEHDPVTFPDQEEDLNSEAAIEKITRVEESTPVSGQGFKAPSTPHQKDFRTQIGFNDRYLFMNELFHNNKELFDTSISKINNAGTLHDARLWIAEELATNMQWDDNDSTVQSFYALVDKYFNTI